MKILTKGLALSSLILSAYSIAGEYYVAPNGDDTASGTSVTTAFKTIAKAAERAQAGDTVYIREGSYEETLRPANSGTAEKPIIFTSYNNEKVIITAMQALSGWQLDSGVVYKTTIDWDLGQENFVMNDATALDLARWPNNTDGDPFTLNSLRNTGGSAASVGVGAYLDYADGIPNLDWSKGGSVFFYGDKPGGGWLAWRAFIESNTSTRVGFDLSTKNPSWIRTWHDPASGGEFFLQGVRGALDYDNEWYFDKVTRTLYVQLPEGAAPVDGHVKMRKRVKTIDLADRSFIHIRDLAVFGGSIEMTGASNNNSLSGVSSFYGNYTLGVTTFFAANSQSINISGKNNTIERSEIAFGAGAGIKDAGDGTIIHNSYIHDFNYLGDYNAAILARGGVNSTVTKNVITRAGRSGIQTINNNSEFAYNDVSFSNLVADDCGLLYTLGGPRNISIHHNWMHDAYSHGNKKKATGIYLDNDSVGFSVFNNVIWNTEWTGIQINWDGQDLDIFNNTLWNNEAAMGAWHKEGTKFTNVRVWNNLSNSDAWEPQSDKQNNLTLRESPFVSVGHGDFRLKASTDPIDYGREIAGITDGFIGASPDAGAYEFGGEDWTAGVSWPLADGPASRCYGLPGEKCAGDEPVPGVVNIPGIVQAEDYVNGLDSTPGNQGGSYRSGDVDISDAADTYGGYTVSHTVNGEWLEYDLDVQIGGEFELRARVAALSAGATLSFALDGVALGEPLQVPASGGDQNWQTLSQRVGRIGAGLHTLRVTVVGGGASLNWLEFADIYVRPNTIAFEGLPPTTILNKAEQVFEIDYFANSPRDIYVSVFTHQWKWLASEKYIAEEGEKTAAISLTLPYVPELGEKFRVKIESRPVGGKWNSPGVVQTSTTVTAVEALERVVNGQFDEQLMHWNIIGRVYPDNTSARVQGISEINQVITGLYPNTHYRLSASIKVNGDDVAHLGVTEHGDTETKVVATDIHFTSYTVDFKTGVEASSAHVYFTIPNATDLGYVDDISVIRLR